MNNLILLKTFLWIIWKQKLFFWKRYLILLLPIVVSLILLPTYNYKHDVQTAENQHFQKQEAHQLYDENYLANKTIYYMPKNIVIEDIMFKVQKTLVLDDHQIQAVENESKLQAILDDKSNDEIIAIRFDMEYNTTTLLLTNITYTIQVCRDDMKTSEEYLKSVQDSYFIPESYDKIDFPYRDSGFLTLQLAIDAKIIDSFAKNPTHFDISLTKYPQLAGAWPTKIHIALVAYLLVFSLILICVFLIIVPLDDTRKSDYLELLNNNWQHRYLYAVVDYVVNLMQITLVLIVYFTILAIFNVFGCINLITPFLFAILFSMAILSYTFFLQTIFRSMSFDATDASIWALLCYLMPILIFQSWKGSFLEMFFPVNMFLRGMDLFEVSVNTEHCSTKDDIAQLTLSLIVCFVFYLLLVLLVISFGSIKKYTKLKLIKATNKTVVEEHLGRYEKIETIDNEVLYIKINKICGSDKKVRNFSLNIYENQITALLGCNGAGKSTILRILTGKMSRSSGRILRNDETEIESFPQYDFVIPYLTCKEQLLFISQLSGVSGENATANVNETLKAVGLENEADVLTSQLKKVQTRCLLLANAKISCVMLIVLDDPTLELDEEGKEKFQKVLSDLKKTTTILIATNCMDEAEALADKVAIMKEGGEVIAHGSLEFLKNECHHQNNPSTSLYVPLDVQHEPLVFFGLVKSLMYKTWTYWKSNWFSLGLMILLMIICVLLIFLPSYSSNKFQAKNITMDKIREPIIVFILRSSFDSPVMQKLIKLFQDNIKQRHAKFEVLTAENYIETIARNNKTQFNENLVAVFGVSVDATKKISIEAFYSRNIVHSVSIAVNLISNVLVQYYSEKNHTIDVINEPIPSFNTVSPNRPTLIMYSHVIPTALVFITILMFLPKTEPWKKSKYPDNISVISYWLANFASDVLAIFAISTVMVLLSKAVDINHIFCAFQLFFIFIMFGCTYLMLIYVVSQMFTNVNNRIMFLGVLHLISKFAPDILLFYVLPDFALLKTLQAFANPNEKDMNFVKFYVSMIVLDIFLFLILICLHKLSMENFNLSRIKKDRKFSTISHEIIQLPSNINLEQGECFGLIGMNTTEQKVVMSKMALCETVSNESPESTCQLYNVLYKPEVGRHPKVENLYPWMTALETLVYFEMIRGVRPNKRLNLREYWLKQMGIGKFRNIKVQIMSAGTVKKLCLAIAMMDFQPLVVLEEPIVGLDPESQEIIIKCIQEFKKTLKTIVLISCGKNVREFCDRLGNIIEGKFEYHNNTERQPSEE